MKKTNKNTSVSKDPDVRKKKPGLNTRMVRSESPDKKLNETLDSLNNYPDAILIHDQKVFLYANPAALNLLGYTSREEMIGIKIWKLIHPEDKESLLENLMDVSRSSTSSYPMAYKIFRKDGSIISVQVLSSPIQYNGEKATQTVLRDVSEYMRLNEALRKNEQELQAIFEILPVGVSIINKQRNISKMNSRLKEIFPLSADDTYSNKHLEWKFLRNDGSPLPPSEIPSFRALQEQVVVNDFIIGVIKEDGNIKWTSISAAPLPDSRAVVVTMDITERKNEQRVLLQQINKIEETERKRFAADIHDDLGPTLSTMHLQMDLLLKLKDPDRIRENIEILKELLREVDTKVHTISHNIIPHLLEDFGLEAAVKDLVKKMELTESFVLDFQSNLKSDRFPGDTELHFYSIISELVNNSIKHSGGTRINLHLNYSNRLLKLTYSDNGKGYNIKESLSKSKGMGLSNIMYRQKLMDATIDWTKKDGINGMKISKKTHLELSK